jgi:hypothetical protein
VTTVQTVGISLVTVAAVAASLAFALQRQDVKRPATTGTGAEAKAPSTEHLQLDHLRSAGF